MLPANPKGSREETLLRAALQSQSGYEAFQEYLTPLVDRIIDLYADYEVPKKELRSVAWTHLRLALDKYESRMDTWRAAAGTRYRFSTYFSWYITRSIEAYLGIPESPLNKSDPRRPRRPEEYDPDS